MQSHITINDEMGILWTEDQPVSRHVRQAMERDGMIRDLVCKLYSDGSDRTSETRNYKDLGGIEREYVCVVKRPPTRYKGAPDFVVLIRPKISSQLWDAVGDIYVKNIPDWLKQ